MCPGTSLHRTRIPESARNICPEAKRGSEQVPAAQFSPAWNAGPRLRRSVERLTIAEGRSPNGARGLCSSGFDRAICAVSHPARADALGMAIGVFDFSLPADTGRRDLRQIRRRPSEPTARVPHRIGSHRGG